MAAHLPGQGDIIALTFNPQAGHEQKGRGAKLIERKNGELLEKVLSIY